MTKRKIFLGLTLLIPAIVFSQRNTERFTYVPAGLVNLETDVSNELPELSFFTTQKKMVQVNGFEVSQLVSLKMYKQFLSAIRQNSGEAMYHALLPDSTIGTPAQFREYLTEPQYEKYPVVGVSWEDALAFCLWRTLKEYDDNASKYLYRLPYHAEWTAANNQMSGKKNSDFNRDYADWLINNYQENRFIHDLNPDIRYDYNESVDNQNRFPYIGNSYFMSFEVPMGRRRLYQFKESGHSFVSFRCVREKTDLASKQEIIEYYRRKWGIKFKGQ